METITDEDRELLRSSLRSLLGSRWPSEHAATLMADPEAMRAIWNGLVEQGVTAFGSPDGPGGAREMIIVQEELGRASCPAPLSAAVLANIALARSYSTTNASADVASELRQQLETLLSQLRGGDAVFALGLEAGDPGEGAAVAGSGPVAQEVIGRRAFVENTQGATHALVSLRRKAQSQLCVGIMPLGSQVAVKETPGYSVPPLAELVFDSAPAFIIDIPRGLHEDLVSLARLLLVARALGAAQRGYEMVVEHVKTRRQFGAPLGSFQAVQHKLANLLINLDGTRLTLEYAADQFDAKAASWPVSAAIACAFANQALRHTVLEIHHAFGAIGFSEEHEMPRHFRRVHGDLARLGGVRAPREILATYLLDSSDSRLPDFDLGAAAANFRAEVREFLGDHWNEQHRAVERTLTLKDRGWDPAFTQLLVAKNWTRLAWPTEYGGQNRSALEQFAYAEEIAYADAPTHAHSCAVDLIAPAILAFGSAEQKASWLPALASNEISCCLGYSEPEAGSDLSGLRARAERDGDHWVINGQKLWTTLGDRASHVWLAVRTDPEAKPKNRGISVLLVPMNTPGITIRPSMAMYGHTFCTVFYENVRVPASCLVGGVNNGWQVITHALACERNVMGGRVAALRRIFDDLVAYLRTARPDGRPWREDAVLRDRIGQLGAEMQVARHFVFRTARLAQTGAVAMCEAAISKVFSGELMERTLELALELLGTAASLSEASSSAPLEGRIEQALRTSIMMVVGGGAAEIQRTLIAQRGIGLPRA
jgi:alkylation response protein AidB-like acyl-CoA dehydrogenase